MSKKILLETLNWLDSLNIGDVADTPCQTRPPPRPISFSPLRSNKVIQIISDPYEDYDQNDATDGREYRRQAKAHAMRKWLRWIRNINQKRRRYSEPINKKLLSKKSKLIKETTIVSVSIIFWNSFCHMAKGLQRWKDFVFRKKKLRLQYSLHHAIQKSILHVGPQRSIYFYHSKIFNLYLLTKRLQLVMMVKHWKLWAITQRQRKSQVFVAWRLKFFKHKLLHNSFRKLEKLQIYVWFVKWKKFSKGWSVEYFRRCVYLRKAICAWRNFVIYGGRLSQVDGIQLGFRFYLLNMLRKLLRSTSEQKKINHTQAMSDAHYRKIILRRSWKRIIDNFHRQFVTRKYFQEVAKTKNRSMLLSAIHSWSNWVKCRKLMQHSMNTIKRKSLRQAVLRWYYIILPPRVRQATNEPRDQLDQTKLENQIHADSDSFCRSYLRHFIGKYRYWHHEHHQIDVVPSETRKLQTHAASVFGHFYFMCNQKILDASPAKKSVAISMHASPFRNYEHQATRYFLLRRFASFLRRLRLTMLLRNRNYKHRLFMRVIARKYLILWKYRVKYTLQPQRTAYFRGRKCGRRYVLHRCLSRWYKSLMNINHHRDVQRRLVRYHRLSFAFQHLWYDRFHIQLKWMQHRVYDSRAKLHYAWTRQQRFFLFWQQWSKDSRKQRICYQAFKKRYPSGHSSKGRELLRKIVRAWRQEYIPYAKTLKHSLSVKIQNRLQLSLKECWLKWSYFFEQRVTTRVLCRRGYRYWSDYVTHRKNLRRRAILLLHTDPYQYLHGASQKVNVNTTKTMSFIEFVIRQVYPAVAFQLISVRHNQKWKPNMLQLGIDSSTGSTTIYERCSTAAEYSNIYRQRFHFMKWKHWVQLRQSEHIQYVQNGLHVISQLNKVQSIYGQLNMITKTKKLFHAFCAWQQVQALRMERLRSILMKSYGQKYFKKWIKTYNRQVMQELLKLPSHITQSSFLSFYHKQDYITHKKRQKKLIGDLKYTELTQPVNKLNFVSPLAMKDMYRYEATQNLQTLNLKVQQQNHNKQVLIDITKECDGRRHRKHNVSSTDANTNLGSEVLAHRNEEDDDDDEHEKDSLAADDQDELSPPPPPPHEETFQHMNDENESSIFSGDMSDLSAMTDDSLHNATINCSKQTSTMKANAHDITVTSIKSFSARVHRSTIASNIKQKFPSSMMSNQQEPKTNFIKSSDRQKLRLDAKEVRSKCNSYTIKFEDFREKAHLKQVSNRK